MASAVTVVCLKKTMKLIVLSNVPGTEPRLKNVTTLRLHNVKSYSSRFLHCSINLDLSYLDMSQNQAHRVLTVCIALDFILSLSF